MIGLAVFITLVLVAVVISTLIKLSTPSASQAAERARISREATATAWRIQKVADQAVADMVTEASRQEGERP